MGTLSLHNRAPQGGKAPEADPLALPVEQVLPEFDPEAHYGEVGGVLGVKYVQGDNFFKPNGDFHSVAPPESRLKPLTKEQESDRLRRLSKTKKLFGNKLAQAAHNAVPESVIKAERENARARAAESLAE